MAAGEGANLHLSRVPKVPRRDTLVRLFPLKTFRLQTGRPVTLLRQADGKLRHEGSIAAFVQPKHPVAECGRLHGASGLDAEGEVKSERGCAGEAIGGGVRRAVPRPPR